MAMSAMLGVALSLVLGAAAEPPPGATDDAIRVEHNDETFVSKIRVRAKDNSIAWADVLRGIARARGNDDTALEGMLPGGRIDLAGTWWQYGRLAMNMALRPHVRFEVEPAAEAGAEPSLVIMLDRAALLASERRLKASLRNSWAAERIARRGYGLKLDDQWAAAPADKNLVIVIHGLDSSPEKCEALMAAIRKADFPCGALRYPNNQPIDASARLLSGELKRLAKEHPERGVSLVTSSMGGLVARAVVEDASLDPGNVRQLVMIVPPNHGSALARFEFALDLWSHLGSEARQKEAKLFYAMIEDGMGEAGGDLLPGSPFLKKLNARPRNPKVRYSILLGTAGPLVPEDLQKLRKAIKDAGEKSRWIRFFGARVHGWLEDMDEVLDGKGDGCVSLARGRLEGVDDIVVFIVTHLHDGRDAARLLDEVVKRLK